MALLKSVNKDTKKILTIIACLFAICLSAAWIYYYHFKRPDPAQFLHQEIGKVMAEETSQLLTNRGRIVVLAIDTPRTPELKIQLQSFEENLKRLGRIKIKKTEFLDTRDQPKYRTGAGLSGSRFVRIMKKNDDVDAIVSFIGVPDLEDEEIKEIGDRHPKFIAESLSVDKLKNLFETNLLHAAVVGRFQFPSPIDNPQSDRDVFNKRFQVIHPEAAKLLNE